MGRPRTPIEERIWRFVAPVGGSECWPWRGAKDRDGYGFIKRHDGTQLRAHRVMFEIRNGPLPDHAQILHTCDNPPCVNPAHLRRGTHDENMADMVQKRRKIGVGRGERNGCAKMTAEMALTIFRTSGTHQAIADRFGFSRQHVTDIKSGRRWGWLTCPE